MKYKKKIVYIQCILIIIVYLLSMTYGYKKVEYFDDMIKAKINVEKLFENIKERKAELGIIMNEKLDINHTGMIGEEFTGMTTTMGDLDSKRLSTNSNFAAYFVKVFKEMKLTKDDIILVNMSSSFPGINLSVISALDTLGLNGILVNSIGASMYGANNEDFTFLEMEEYLKHKGLIKNKISAYSWGGDWDIGHNFSPGVQDKINSRIKNIKIKKFYTKNIDENFKNKCEYYDSFGKPKIFINIGGNILFQRLLKRYDNKGVKTISILNLKFIGNKLGFSIRQKKNIESVKIYYKSRKNIFEILIIIIFIGGLLLIFKKGDTDEEE